MPVGQRMWVDNELTKLGQMRSQGATLADIATQLDRTKGSVRGALRQGKYAKALPRAMLYMREFGARATVEEIAARLGVKPNTVRKTRIRLYGTMERASKEYLKQKAAREGREV